VKHPVYITEMDIFLEVLLERSQDFGYCQIKGKLSGFSSRMTLCLNAT